MSKPKRKVRSHPRRKIGIHRDLDLASDDIRTMESSLDILLARDGKREGAYSLPPGVVSDVGLIVMITTTKLGVFPEGFEIAPGMMVFSAPK
jgi:hypothetical protein